MFRATAIQSHAFSIYIDGNLMGANWDLTKQCCDYINITVPLKHFTAGTHKIDILSSSLGIENGGDNMENFMKGIVGDIFLGSANITQPQGNQWWTMQKGLVGEALEIYTPDNRNLVNWTSLSPINTPITWYSTTFTTPNIPGSVALDITGLGKGLAYVNGNCLGRYWTLLPTTCGDNLGCFHLDTSCFAPTQSIYHIAPDWLNKSGNNTLILFEELGISSLFDVKIVVVS